MQVRYHIYIYFSLSFSADNEYRYNEYILLKSYLLMLQKTFISGMWDHQSILASARFLFNFSRSSCHEELERHQSIKLGMCLFGCDGAASKIFIRDHRSRMHLLNAVLFRCAGLNAIKSHKERESFNNASPGVILSKRSETWNSIN